MSESMANKILSMLSKMSEKEISEGLQKAADKLNSSQSKDIIDKMRKLNVGEILGNQNPSSKDTTNNFNQSDLNNLLANKEELSNKLQQMIEKLKNNNN